MRVDDSLLRLRRFVAVRSVPLFVVLLLGGVVCLGAGVVLHDDVPTKTVEHQQHTLTVGTVMDTSTVATGNSSLYPRGTSLENLPVYLNSVSSNLTLSLRTEVDAPTEATIGQQMFLVHRISYSGDVFWNRSQIVASNSGVLSEGALEASGTVDIADVRRETRSLRSEVGGGAKVSSFVVANTTYETERYTGSTEEEAKLKISESSYSVVGEVNTSERRSTSVETEKTDESSVVTFFGATVPVRSAALVGLGFVLVFVALSVVAYARNAPPAEKLEREIEIVRYSDWISDGEVPWNTVDRRVELDSLGDAVDVGIDASKRTLYDTERGIYGVLDGDTLYYYRPEDDEDSG